MAQDPKAKENNEEAAPKKSKKLLIIVLILLLLGGGAAAGWYFFIKSKPQLTATQKQKEAEAHAAPPIYVALETFTANLSGGDEVIQIDISVLVSKEEDAVFVKTHMPVLRDRILNLLTTKDAESLKTVDGKLSLSKEIIKEANKSYGKQTQKLEIQGVFFTSFVIQ